MNKDVIYIEPEDDITDIITKIEKAKEKIVALVPPKKAGVFRSIVNIKLITKAAAGAKKTVVLVTTDPSIMKLAAATKLPVTKDLQSAPSVPTLETKTEKDVEKDAVKEEISENADNDEAEDEKNESETEDDDENGEGSDNDVTTEDKSNEKKTKESLMAMKRKGNSPGNKLTNWIKEHKKLTLACGVLLIGLILLLIWMFAIAPSVSVTVDIKTTQNNFSESVTFTTNLSDEKVEDGKFFLEEKKIESVEEKEFEATGSKNIGKKASGEVVVYAYFKNKGAVAINAGSTFTISGLSYTSEKDASLSWGGEDVCENNSQASLALSGCLISGRVEVVAVAPGTNYNIAASSNGWSTTANVGVYSDQAMTGGTDEMITVVQQSDIDKAKEELNSTSESEDKEKLYETINDTAMAIDSSFLQTTSSAVSTPAVGEEVKNGEKASIKITITTSVFVIDKTKIEEFIREKAKLEDNQKIYEINSPFIENFTKTDSGYTGKLKTAYAVGPKVTENDIIEVIKGKGLGEAQHDLKDIDGITAVSIDKSYPWVMSIPGDANKITVNLEIKE